MGRLHFRKGIRRLEHYIPSKPIKEVKAQGGLKEITRMASNENPLGPSPKALAAMRKELNKVHQYPDGPCTLLRKEMAQKFNITEDMIIFSNGAENVISLLGKAFINEGDDVIMANPTFPLYLTVTRIMGGRPVCVKLKNHIHDLKTMMKRVGEGTKMVFICNPNNPTGTIVDRHELDLFISQIPKYVLIILDEAYIEFVSDAEYPTGINYIKKGYNVISIRTFSKLYGLAGMRIGYAIGRRDMVAALDSVREPFAVSRLAQVAALGALEDEGFRERVLTNNREGMAYLSGEFDRMGISYVPSHTNFIFVHLKRHARKISESLLREGIHIREGHSFGYHSFARITIGTMEENRRLINVLKRIL